MPDVMIHEFLLGFIKIYILQHAEREIVCSKEIHEQLARYGYEISYGTLYNTFHGLEEKGYLLHEDRNVKGKIRKYYRITDKGKVALKKARERTREIFDGLDEIASSNQL